LPRKQVGESRPTIANDAEINGRQQCGSTLIHAHPRITTKHMASKATGTEAVRFRDTDLAIQIIVLPEEFVEFVLRLDAKVLPVNPPTGVSRSTILPPVLEC